jgi:hypothetical protein
MRPVVLVPLLLAAAVAIFAVAPHPAGADHKDNDHAGMLYPPVDQYEMNSRTVNGQTI